MKNKGQRAESFEIQKLKLEIELLKQQEKAAERQDEMEERKAKRWYLPSGKSDYLFVFTFFLLLFVAFI